MKNRKPIIILILLIVAGICVYFPIVAPVVKSFISILTQLGAVTGALAAFIPVCERLCTSY